MSENFEGFRLSPQQKRLWRLQQALPGRSSYGHADFIIEGQVVPVRLAAALTQIVAQHEILRTTFRCLPGTMLPLQVLDDPYEVSLTQHDISDWTAMKQATALAQRADLHPTTSASLEEVPTLGAALIQLAPERHLLRLTMPLLCADAQTLRQMGSAIGKSYAGAGEDDESIQYIDVADIFNDVLESEETEAGRTYWEQTRTHPLRLAQIPSASLPNATVSGTAAVQHRVPIGVTRALEGFAAQSNTSIAAVCLAAWLTVLARLSGESSITLGVRYDGRTYQGLDTAIGLFARTIPFTAAIDPTTPFQTLVARVHQHAETLKEWQEYFSWEVWSGRTNEDDISFFPFAFEFDALPLPYEAEGTRITLHHTEGGHDHATITLRFYQTDDGLAMAIAYDASLVSSSLAERLLDQIDTLLAAATRQPQAPVASLDILSAAAREAIVVTRNRTERAYPQDKGFLHLFEAQVARGSERPALTFRDETWTFAQLDARANQIANTLQQMGVSAESVVALFVERSPHMVAAILGVLKAGGTYLPLDIRHPTERLRWMLEDSNVGIVLTQDALEASLPDGTHGIVVLDRGADVIATASTTPPDTAFDPLGLAYIIYTSGSTGKPKGTMITHAGLMNYITWAGAYYQMAEGAGVLVHTPLAFDLTVTTIIVPLSVGQRIILVPESQGVDELHALLRTESNHSTIKITPAHVEALRHLPDFAQAAHNVKALVIGGEALFGSSLAEWRTTAPDVRLINEYGPTETVVGCCIYEVPAGIPAPGAVPIGYPIANTTLYVLDAYGQPTPDGVPGELYVGGAGVARGYGNHPALTAERFVPDPFSQTPGARLYRTGDRVRYLPNGALDYLGRLDQQVKVRGFRVELGEIESVISQHPAVRETAVLMHDSNTGEAGQPRLIAYSVPTVDAPYPTAEVQRFLRDQLPEYMIPSRLVWVEAMPLTANGKIDRRALNAIKLEDPAATYVAPRTALEMVLVNVWADLLGISQVGIHTSFFDLGGHSLLLIQLNSRLRRGFGVDLGLNALFEAPTIEGMAGLLTARESTSGQMEADARAMLGGDDTANKSAALPGIRPRPNPEERPLSFAQQRLWFFDQLNPDSYTYNNVWAMRLTGNLDIAALEQSVSEIVARHEVLRISFASVRGEPLQVVAPPAPVQLPTYDLRNSTPETREAETQRLIDEAVRHPFDLTEGPLWRIALIQESNKHSILVLTMHHIVSDGWSMDILSQEIAALYTAFTQGQPSPLPPLPIQYADFAYWQREQLQGEYLDRQIDYWKEQLRDLPTLALATDMPRPEIQRYEGANQTLAIPLKVSDQIKAVGRDENATLFMVLMAGFNVLMSYYTDQEDIVVGTDVANRDQSEVEGLIGFFVNQLTLRTDLSGNPTLREVVRRVRDVARAAYEHQHLPFEQVIQALHIERNLGLAPLFQAKMFLQHAPPTASELPDLTLEVLPFDPRIARLDLVVGLWDAADGISGWFNYNTTLWTAPTIARMTDHFTTILGLLATQPDIPLSEVKAQIAAADEAYRQAERERRTSAKSKKWKSRMHTD